MKKRDEMQQPTKRATTGTARDREKAQKNERKRNIFFSFRLKYEKRKEEKCKAENK